MHVRECDSGQDHQYGRTGGVAGRWMSHLNTLIRQEGYTFYFPFQLLKVQMTDFYTYLYTKLVLNTVSVHIFLIEFWVQIYKK